MSWGLILAVAFITSARAAAPTIAQREVNYLLGFIAASGCEFYRNGSWHDSKSAQAHLRSKYEMLAAGKRINTAEDFIELVATKSSLSGLPYQVRCGGGDAVTTNQWLRDLLAHYRSHAT